MRTPGDMTPNKLRPGSLEHGGDDLIVNKRAVTLRLRPVKKVGRQRGRPQCRTPGELRLTLSSR